ncbi:MAG: acyltransferase, partial [Chloroflexota bacterium]
RYTSLTSPNFDQMYSASYFMMRFLEQFIIPSIPAFLLVSGYFIAFAAGKKETIEWKFILGRVKYLVIPFVLWTTIMLGYNITQGERFDALGIVALYVFGQATPAFYFVPLLVSLYVISPWIIKFARSNWKLLLVTTAVVQILAQSGKYPLILDMNIPGREVLNIVTAGWFFAGNIFWFSAGVILGLQQNTIKAFLQRIRYALLSLIPALFAIGMIEWEWLLRNSNRDWIGPRETLLDNVYSLVFLGFLIGVINLKLPYQQWLNDLGAKSFGIYLSHSLVLSLGAKTIYHIVPQLLSIPLLFLVVLFIIGLGIPLLMMEITHRSPLKRYYVYFFG